MTLALLPTTISATPMNGAFNYDVNTQVIYYSNTAATGDFQINFRGDGLTTFASAVPVGNTLQVMLFVTIGSTPRRLTAITVDGSAVTEISWFANLPYTCIANQIAQIPINITHSGVGSFIVY